MTFLHSALRRTILAAAESARLQRFVRRHGMRLGAARFVAGETIDEAVPVLRRLNERGLPTNTTLLGEGIRDEAETGSWSTSTRRCSTAFRTSDSRPTSRSSSRTSGSRSTRSSRSRTSPSSSITRSTGANFIRIDMEESAYVDATLRIYRRLRESGRDNVGTVLQSYLCRTEADLESLLDLEPNLRLVKGAYLEHPDVAYPEKEDVDAAYVRLRRADARRDGVHRDRNTRRAADRARDRVCRAERHPADRFQFQMLYGVRPKLQLELVRRGFSVLVATPYGPDWYRYLMRRLAERPANLMFFARSLVRR